MHHRPAPFCALALLGAFWTQAPALDLIKQHDFSVSADLKVLAGFRHGENLNFGLGAVKGFGSLSSTGEQSRNDLQLALKPGLNFDYSLGNSTVYGGSTAAFATTQLDGELSGQMAQSGDGVAKVDSAYLGWRNHWLDVSYGAQEFTVGDGFLIGDGTFNQGHDNGQYWIGAFTAWRNTGIIKLNTSPVRADFFWLRTDADLGDSRIVGFNFENTAKDRFGRFGFAYFEVFDDNGRNGFAGARVSSVRAEGLHWPSLPQLQFFGEFVAQRGKVDRTGARIEANGWYTELNYQFTKLPLTPKFYYRYAYFSGDQPGTPEYEEYRGMFFTIFKRDWDTWYQGEIAGEFFLFNENQETNMAKVKVFPTQRSAVGFWYYHHDLVTPQYFGLPTRHLEWNDEVNLSFEFFPNDRLYWYLGAAWATPGAAAREVFGREDQTVVQTFISYTFR